MLSLDKMNSAQRLMRSWGRLKVINNVMKKLKSLFIDIKNNIDTISVKTEFFYFCVVAILYIILGVLNYFTYGHFCLIIMLCGFGLV